jgi:hypothetical protein
MLKEYLFEASHTQYEPEINGFEQLYPLGTLVIEEFRTNPPAQSVLFKTRMNRYQGFPFNISAFNCSLVK